MTETIVNPDWEKHYRGRVHCPNCGTEKVTDPASRAGSGWPMHCGLKMLEGCSPGDALPRKIK